MLNYARNDTHYLLYIYDRMRLELWARGSEQPVQARVVWQRSRDICLKVRRWGRTPFRTTDLGSIPNVLYGPGREQAPSTAKCGPKPEGSLGFEERSPGWIPTGCPLVFPRNSSNPSSRMSPTWSCTGSRRSTSTHSS